MNYFSYFKLPKSFEINKKKLSRKYYSLQKKYHPDLHQNSSKKKKSIF
ncbi:MAG: hypothetical protein G8D24_02105 [Buchnera aphidicola (Periphyllus lyropictus)]|nr:hypothetical protein [Buchnera aphidicola]NIH16833.1 hypothetical protein [Buchnera aphidicola (Periphyllus lyropictus)]USS94704.1 hypothetical protein M5J13_00555 [Buchnera aphidicola (Periphyllus lyropictus)]